MLFFAFLLSINSFAAVVSDNDGSAFITKAEFDSLKNSFQSQLNGYNSNIDAKIDNAIASYLAGIKVETSETKDLPLNNWETVTMINGIIKPEFAYPSVNLTGLLMGGFGSYDGKSLTDPEWVNEYWAYGNATYTQSTSTTSSRPTIKNVKEDGSDDSKMTWDGVKTKWREVINATAAFYSLDGLYAFELSGVTNMFYLYQFTDFNGAGYKADLSSNLSSFWNVGYGYYSSYNSYGYHEFVRADRGGDLVTSLVFKVSTDEKKNYEHICNWSNSYKTWEVYNENFTNTMRTSLYDNKISNDLFDLTTRTGQWYGEKFPSWYNYNTRQKARWSSLDMTNRNYMKTIITTKIPRIGLYNTSVAPNLIYQTYDNYKQILDGKSYDFPKHNLVNGFILLYGKKDDEIEWDPTFANLSSTEAGVCDGTEEVCLVLSLKPFGDGTYTGGTSDDDLINIYNFASETPEKYPVSKNKKMKLKFKMPDDGFVIAKWFPVLNNDSYINTKDWQVDLDLKSCGTYRRKKAE